MKLINININKYFHMIPLWKSPIKLPVELPVELPVAIDPTDRQAADCCSMVWADQAWQATDQYNRKNPGPENT